MTSQIYISKRCNHCIRLLKELKERPDIQGKIRIISIDEEPYPDYIKNVPTMVNGNKLFNAGEIFQMLEESKKVRQQQQQQQQQHPQHSQHDRLSQEPLDKIKSSVGCPVGGSGKDEVCDINGFCMDSSGLSYSNINGDDNILGDDGNAQFSPIDFKHESIENVQLSGPSSRRSSQVDSDYEKMMQERGKLNQGPKIM